VATGTRAGMAFIDVANGGPLIPPELVPSLFEPFRRLSDRAGSPDGMGLGLSIVRSVALAHRGHATARPRSGWIGAGQGSMSSATARSTAAIFFASLASGCLPRR
jgi:signal transduction histidine kinase